MKWHYYTMCKWSIKLNKCVGTENTHKKSKNIGGKQLSVIMSAMMMIVWHHYSFIPFLTVVKTLFFILKLYKY